MSRTSSRFSFRRATALVLLVSLLSPGLALARQPGSVPGGSSFEQSVMPSFFTSFSQSFGMLFGMLEGQQASGQDMPQPERPLPERKAPKLPPTKAEREAKVGSIKVDLDGDLTIESGVRRILMAIPLDKDGDPIHGLLAEWESSDKNTISITKDGRAVAGNPGKAKLTARAGQKQVSLQVTVTELAKVQPNSAVGETKIVASWRAAKEARQNKHHPRLVSPTPPVQQTQGFGSRLPDSEASSLYWAQNDVGAPAGRTEPGAATPPAAIAGTETPLSSNFAFSVPIMNLPGRGIDLKLALSYNSRLWHKSIVSGATRLTYDVDSGYPAPGFQLGYGYIESHGAAGLTLVDGDGTRHQLRKWSTNPDDLNYDTVDGTFIHFTSDHRYYPTRGWADRSDGTRVYYSSVWSGGTMMSHPVQIMDRNGNYILISYGYGGLITAITDTLGRYVSFNYEYDPQSWNCPNNKYSQCYKLVSIVIPGRQVRLYYEIIPINPAGSFSVLTQAPATARVIRYVYFPGTQSGFRYDYSSYGMISGIKQLRGMTVSTTLVNQQGTVTSEGQIAATSSYNYPQTPANLSDAPAFIQRTDDWAGRTSAQSIYNFSVNQSAGTSTITAPNGSVTTSQTIVAQGSWNDGLVTDITQQGGGLTVTAHNTWEPDSAGVNPRLQQTQVTNQANQTRTTQFSYTTHNNVSVIRELGFNNEELRRTETTYETQSWWTGIGGYPGAGKRVLRLPTSVKIFAGGAGQPAARVDYAYDQYAFYLPVALTWRDGLVMHDEAYDPYSDSGTGNANFRGNLTSSTRYINAADPNQGTIVDTKAYDIAGNLVSQTANCCRQKAYDYFSGYYFANVTQMTQGDTQHQQNAIYDFNTGLMTQSTDQNGQVTTYEYYPGSQRLYRVTRPDGGYTIMEYGDLLYADPDQSHLHSWTKTRTLIEGTMVAEEWKYFDGRGQVVRTFGAQTPQGRATRDIEYDAMGRVVRGSNPYYSAAGAASAINPGGLWATGQYDPFSRVTQLTLPDQTTTQAAYTGSVMTVTDQANKSRRRVTDALGRLARMDEPDSSGNLGSVSSPAQPTTYQYDALDNLIHITQGAQHRYFKYDSLSRMTYERQPEQDAPHAAADALTGNSSWSRKIDYNGFSLVSKVTDARGVATNFTYDTLNRLISKTYSDGTPAVQYIHDEARYPDGGGEAYSNRGRLTTVSTGNNQFYQQFNYNRMGKVVMQRQTAGGNPFEIQYSYNPGGLLTEEWIRGEPPDLWPSYLTAYSLDEKRSYFYDAAGRLTSVNRGSHSAPQAAYASALSYNAAGVLESLTYGNGATETHSYNARLQLTSQSLVKAGAVLQRYDYQYGQVNQLTGAVDPMMNNGQLARSDGFIGGTPQSPVKQWEERFSYDSLARLDVASEYRGDNGSLTWRADYDYDRYGNRMQTGGQNTNLSYVPVQSSEINPATNRFTAGVTYDAAGQTLTDAKFRNMQYQYNPEGRMKYSANLDGSNTSTSVYDGLGQRVQTTNAVVTKNYVYDMNGSVVAEYDGTDGTSYGTLKRLSVCAGGRLLAVDEAQTNGTKVTSYVMADRQGSTRVVMNAAGAVTSRHDYLPFGEELGAGTGAPGSPTGMRTAAQGYSVADKVRQRYADTRRDDATGLDHTLWRKLETRSGRWTTPDPYGKSLRVANPQSFNRYAYVHNDPVNFVDPSGLEYGYHVTPLTDAEICQIFNICGGEGLPGMMGNDTGMMIELPSPGVPGGGEFDPQNPVYPPVTDKDINIVDGSKPFDTIGAQVVKDIMDIANNRGCSDAFKKYGLRIPYDLVLSDKIRIVPQGFLYNDAAAQTLGISQDLVESIRYDLSPGIIFGPNSAATTIGGASPIIVIGSGATDERYLGIKSVLIHEFIHAGGKPGSGSGDNGDLTSFDGYKEIQQACGGKSK